MRKKIYGIQKYTTQGGWRFAWLLTKPFHPTRKEAEEYVKQHKIRNFCIVTLRVE